MQIDSYHGAIIGVPRCQLCEILDPNGFRILCGIPKPGVIGTIPGLRAVMVQNHSHAKFISLCHDPVHDFESTESPQVRIFAEVYSIGCTSSIEKFITVWQPDGIESFRLHLIHHFDIPSAPQSMWSEISRLEAEPVDACKTHRLPRFVNDLIPNS